MQSVALSVDAGTLAHGEGCAVRGVTHEWRGVRAVSERG
jgi:hypothetical protein